MASGAAKVVLHYVFNGIISMHEMEIERRPYHRNCSCALHKPKGSYPKPCFHHQNIAFPKKQSRHDCSLSITVSEFSSSSSLSQSTSIRSRKDSSEAIKSRG